MAKPRWETQASLPAGSVCLFVEHSTRGARARTLLQIHGESRSRLARRQQIGAVGIVSIIIIIIIFIGVLSIAPIDESVGRELGTRENMICEPLASERASRKSFRPNLGEFMQLALSWSADEPTRERERSSVMGAAGCYLPPSRRRLVNTCRRVAPGSAIKSLAKFTC